MAGLSKRWVYKVSRGGVFLGFLPNVISPFGYSQNINTAGAQLQITVGINPDNVREDPSEWITESGDTITTEDGDTIIIERQPDLVGNSNSQSLIRNKNDVAVYEYSDNYPNGKLVFSGYISKWAAAFGGSGVDVTILSYGVELDNYLIQGSVTVDVSQASSNATYSGASYGKDPVGAKTVQSWVVGAGVNNLAAVDIKLAAMISDDIGDTLQMDIFSSLADAQNDVNSLGSGTAIIQSLTPTVQKITLSVSIPVTAGQTYYWRLRPLLGVLTNYTLEYQNTDVYANGQAYYSDATVGGGGGGGWTTLNYDFYFKTYYTAGATRSPFNSNDPSNTVKSIIDSYVSRGGIINYGSGTVDLTGTISSYVFNLNTILEGIKKMAELSPADFYWYVDPGSSILYFKEASTTATHTFIKGRHLETVNITASIEDVKNVVYFSGGDVGGGVNLFTTQSDLASIAANRLGLARLSDQRVTLAATADAVMQNYLDHNADEVYQSVITILETTYDITTIKPGDMIAFSGFGTFVDRLLLQAAGIQRGTDEIGITLGVMPKRATKTIEDLLRAITDLQTVDNPDTPS